MVKAKIDEAIHRLEREKAQLEDEMTRVPRLMWSIALAVPAFFLWGALGFVLTALASMALVATAYYLLYVRIREAQGELRDLAMEKEKLP